MKLSIRAICFMGMFTAVLSVLSIFQIPTPWGVPFTLQTFAVALCGFVLGKWYGTGATALYVLIGLVAVPVFSGMKGGPAVLSGMTGGYIVGFIGMAFLCGVGIDLINKKTGFLAAIPFGILGLAFCHLLGTIWFSVVAKSNPWEAFMLASFPYLLKDVLSVVGAYIAAVGVRKGLEAAHIMDWDISSKGHVSAS